MENEVGVSNTASHPFNRRDFLKNALSILKNLPSLIVSSGKNADTAINEALTRVGTLIGASRAYVMLHEKEDKYLRNTHELVNQRIGPVMFSWPLYDYEYDIPSLKKIIANDTVFYGHTRDLPGDLNTVLSKQGVKSILIAPVVKDRVAIGMVGADFCEIECDFSEPFAEVLQCLAGLVALALERKQQLTILGKLMQIRDTMTELSPLLEGRAPMEEPSVGIQGGRPTTLLDAERKLIIETLEMYNGNKLKTAKHLGLTWPSLDRRCKKLSIEVRRK